MKRLVAYGILTGLASAGWNFLEYTLTYKGHPVGRFSGVIAVLFLFVGLWQGISAYRNQDKGGVITYWEAVLAGMLIALVAGLIQASFVYVYHVVINPAFASYVLEMKRQELAAQGATPAQLAQVARKIRDVYQPLRLSLGILGGCMVVGMIMTLIMASFLKKYPRE
jgi:hypothetical protein